MSNLVKRLWSITEEQDIFIEERAKATGAPKSEVVRRMLDLAIKLKKANGNVREMGAIEAVDNIIAMVTNLRNKMKEQLNEKD